MSTIYYPSCKFTAMSPESSEKISDYLSREHDITIEGCCRPSHPHLTAQDTAITICNTCAAICSEDSPAKIISLSFLL